MHKNLTRQEQLEKADMTIDENKSETSIFTAMNVNRFYKISCGLETAQLRGESKTAANRKINANFLFGGFIASYESLCVIKQLCFPACVTQSGRVSTVVRELPQIKNFPACRQAGFIPYALSAMVWRQCDLEHFCEKRADRTSSDKPCLPFFAK